MVFCLSHVGTQRDPPPPSPYWDIFDQWEQGSTCNGYCGLRFLALRGANIATSFILCKKYYRFYHCKFAVRCLSVSVISHGGIPSFGAGRGPAGLFTRWHRSLAVSHDGTRWDPHPFSILGAPIYKPPCGSELLHALCNGLSSK